MNLNTPDIADDTTRRLWNYVERKFQNSGKTEFPTVREVSRGTGVSQKNIEEAAESCEYLMLTGYNIEGITLPDLYLETLT